MAAQLPAVRLPREQAHGPRAHRPTLRVPPPTAVKLWGETSSNFGLVASTGLEPVFAVRHALSGAGG